MAVSVVSRQKHVSGTQNSQTYTPTISFAAAQAHDICIVFVTADGNPTLTTASSGWAKIGNQASYSTTVTGAVFCCADVSGTGQGGLQVDSDASEQYSCQIYLIRGGDKNNITVATAATGSSTNPDPPNCNPAISEPYCWLTSHHGDSTTVATVAPTNFINLQTQAGGGTNGASTDSAEYLSTAASMNPGVFTCATEQWVSFTVAIPPPFAGAGASNGTSAADAGGSYAPVINSGAGHADGTSSADAGGSSQSTISGAGHADGTSAASGQAGFTGKADGTSSANAVGVTARVARGEAFGYSSVSAVGLQLSSSGAGAAFGISFNTTDHVLTDGNGFPISDQNGQFLTDNTSSIGAVGQEITGTIESGAGAANGTSTATATGVKAWGAGYLQLVGVSTNAGTTVTMPSGRQIGDLELMWAVCATSATSPTRPSGWASSIATSTGNNIGARLSFRFCSDTSDTSGTWTNATHLICAVYRYCKGIGPVGTNNAAGTTITFPTGGNYSEQAGHSWEFAGVGASAATNADLCPSSPAQLYNKAKVGTGPMAAVDDSDGGLTNWLSNGTVTVSPTGNVTSVCIELQADASTWNPSSRNANITNGGNQLTSKVNVAPSSDGCQNASLPRYYGKYVMKFTASTDKATSGYAVGLADPINNSNFSLNLGTNAYSLKWLNTGAVSVNGSTIGTAASYTNSDTLYIAVDFDNNKAWFKVGAGNWNNDGSANPDTNTGGFSLSTFTHTYGIVAARSMVNGGGTEAVGIVFDGSASGHGLSLFLPWDNSIASSVGNADGTSSATADGIDASAPTVESGAGNADGTSTGAATGAYAPATNSGVGNADGTSAADGIASGINPGAGNADGASAANAVAKAVIYPVIQRINSTTNAGNTVTMPSGRQVGDLEVILAFNNSSTTIPSMPSGDGWINENTRQGTACAARMAYRWCSDESDVSGTWTNANYIICVVYRGVRAVGNNSINSGSGTTITFGTATQGQGTVSGDTWALYGVCSVTATNLATAMPVGLSNVNAVGSGPQIAIDDTNGGTTGYAGGTATGDVTGAWITQALLLYAEGSGFEPYQRSAACTVSTDQYTATVTGTPTTVHTSGAPAHRFGKWVFGMKTSDHASTAGYSCGIVTTDQAATRDAALGATTASMSWENDGSIKINGSTVGTIAGYTNGDNLLLAFDFDAKKFWGKVNNGNWNNNAAYNPDAGTGGVDISTLTYGNGFVFARAYASGGSTETNGYIVDGSPVSGLTAFAVWDTVYAHAAGAANGTSSANADGASFQINSGAGHADGTSTGAATGAYAPATNSGVGHADGASSVSGQAGFTGKADGTSTATATGAYAPATNSGAGHADGASSVSGQAGFTGNADGTSTATATGAYAPSTASGAGHADATSTGTATGAYAPSINAKAGAADGTSTATATGAYAPAINSGVGHADGSSTGAATGYYVESIASGAGHADGTSTATAEGQQAGSVNSGAGHADGTSSASGQAGFTGNANATSTATATGYYAPSTASGVGHADASSTGNAPSSIVLFGVGHADGTSSANARTPSLTVGAANATSSAEATGYYVESIASGVGNADGHSNATGDASYGLSIVSGVGAADGTSTGTATGAYAPSINSKAGAANATSSADAVGDYAPSINGKAGTSSATSSATATGAYAPAINEGVGHADGSSTSAATGAYAPSINAKAGAANATSSANAVGDYAPATNAGVGHANAISNANAVGEYVGTYAEGAGATNATSSANAVSSIVLSGVGAAAAISTSEATGYYAPTVFIAHGNANLISSAEGYSQADKNSVARSDGLSNVTGYGSSIYSSVGLAEAYSFVNGVYIDFRKAHFGHGLIGEADTTIVRGKSSKNRLSGRSSKTEV